MRVILPAALQLVHHINQVPQRTPQPVQPPHHQRVTRPQLLQYPGQPRAGIKLARRSVSERPVAARRGHRGHRAVLRIRVLLQRRHPRIPQQVTHPPQVLQLILRLGDGRSCGCSSRLPPSGQGPEGLSATRGYPLRGGTATVGLLHARATSQAVVGGVFQAAVLRGGDEVAPRQLGTGEPQAPPTGPGGDLDVGESQIVDGFDGGEQVGVGGHHDRGVEVLGQSWPSAPGRPPARRRCLSLRRGCRASRRGTAAAGG